MKSKNTYLKGNNR